MSLRKLINGHCKSCIYDPKAAGTWRQQVELCPCVESCHLWPLRPVSNAPIPESVLGHYGLTKHPFRPIGEQSEPHSSGT